MKKIYFSMIIMLLALSINAFTQINQSKTYHQFPSSNELGEIRVSPAGRLLYKTFTFYDKLSIQPLKNKSKELNATIQINDSIYNWYWDTISNGWQVVNKTINIVYDASNNLTSNLTQSWNSSAWENSAIWTYTYDVKNNRTSELWQIYQNWDGGRLENFSNKTYTYDASNNLTIEIWAYWDGSFWGTNPTKITRTYDANNNKISEFWEGGSATTAKIFYTYDASNNNTKIVEQVNTGSGWVNYLQATYTLNADNKQTSYTEQPWNGSDWGFSRKDTLTYDANKNQIGFSSQNWDGSSWLNSSRRTSAYDANNILISNLAQNWNGNAWVNSSKDTLTYDSNNNNTGNFGQNWNGSDWVKAFTQKAGFDANNFTIYNTYKYWNTSGTQVQFSDSAYNYFHTVITGIKEVDKSGITVYPNPTNGKFTISGSSISTSIEIYNLSGARVYADLNSKNQTSKEIDLSGYSKGIYLIKIYDGKKIQSRKIVVQ